MQTATLSQGCSLMETKKRSETDYSQRVRNALLHEQGLTVKDLAGKLKLNRQFMAGFLSALEEKGEIYHRKVGPARTYFVNDLKVNR